MHNLVRIFLAALAICPVLGLASESEESIFSFDAFGTLGVVHSDEDQADFSGTTLYDGGVGYSRAVAANVDSLIGGQLTADFSDRLTAVVQVISQRKPNGEYTPHVEWANLRYQFTPELNIRIGRSVLSTFMESTYRNINYATHWVRPPIEVYGLVPITSRDGISANYTFVRQDIMNSLELTYGEKKTDLTDGHSLEVNESWGISNTFERGHLTIHASYQRAYLNLDSYEGLKATSSPFGTVGENTAAFYNPTDSKISYVGVGASYDPGPWFLMTEWGQTKSDSIVGEKSAAYVSGGYRFGRLTPYITLARARREAFPAESVLDLSALPQALALAAVSLNKELLSFQATLPIQDSISVGVRWEVNRRVAFSAQLDHSNMLAGSSGNLANLQPGFKHGGSLNLVSASLSFVFP